MKVIFLYLFLIFFLSGCVWKSYSFGQSINEKYSFKDFTGMSFKGTSVLEFNNTIIVGSCFYQESSESDLILSEIVKDIFPDGMVNVIFKRCNLDNVKIPIGNTVDKTNSTRKIRIQNDWDDWVLNDSLNPVEPMNKEDRIKSGISVNPEDIPSEKMTEEERREFEISFDNIVIS
jgi:hypothetical protein